MDVVALAQHNRDAAAAALVHRQSDEVIALVRATSSRLGVAVGALPVVLGGSILRHGGEKSAARLMLPSERWRASSDRLATSSATIIKFEVVKTLN